MSFVKSSINIVNFTNRSGGVTFEIPKSFFPKTKKKTSRINLDEDIKPFDYWGIYEVDEESFKDDNPIVKFNNYEDLELTSKECCGYLTDRIIAACSSHLDINPLTKRYVLCKCDLTNKKLRNIELLYYHHYLQHIDLSVNKLETLQPLEGIPFLIYLDASHNSLITVLDFKPPYYLTYVNLSNNKIEYLHDLSGFWSLKKLDLSHNKIQKIIGFENLKYLEVLNLSYNKIKVIENLDHLNIITLELNRNHIQRFVSDEFHGFKTMPKLCYVSLSHNELNSLAIFKNAKSVQSIYIENNSIKNPIELSYLKDLNLLIYLNLINNPITTHTKYKSLVLFACKKLNFLDTKEVDTILKVEAEAIYNPTVDAKVAEVNATTTILTQMQKLKNISVHCLPCDSEISPIVILVGPPGCRAELIIKNICFNTSTHELHKFKLHTTCRNPNFQENYYVISDPLFNDIAKAGEFMVLFETFKCHFGLHYDEFEKNNDKKNIILLYTDIYSALILRLRGYRPWLILTMPRDKDVHKYWFDEDFKYYRVRMTPASNDNGIKSKCLCGNEKECDNKFKCPETCLKYITDITDNQPVESDPKYPGLSCHDDILCDILQTRNLYLTFHEENAGIFYETIYTDEPEDCYRKLHDIFLRIIENIEINKNEYVIEKDEVYDTIIGERLRKFNREIDSIIHCKLPGCGDI